MKTLRILSIVFAMGALMSCEKDEVQTSQDSTVSGAAVKGYVEHATVTFYEFQANGERGKLVASTQTDVKGNYSINTDYRGPVEVVITKGQYLDEASGEMVDQGSNELRSIVVLGETNQQVAVTALTTIAAQYVNANASVGIETAIANANKEVAATFGLEGTDLNKEIPADLSHANNGLSKAQAQYGAVQAGLSQIVKDNAKAPEDLLILINEMAKDFEDGQMDGKSGSQALEFSLSITSENALAGLNIAIESFLNGPNNKSGHTSGSIDITVPRR